MFFIVANFPWNFPLKKASLFNKKEGKIKNEKQNIFITDIPRFKGGKWLLKNLNLSVEILSVKSYSKSLH